MRQANAVILTLFSKRDEILIKNLYECKGCNARQFITKFLDKALDEEQHQQAAGEVRIRNSRQASGRPRAATDALRAY